MASPLHLRSDHWYHDFAREIIRTRGKRLTDSCPSTNLSQFNTSGSGWYEDFARETIRTRGAAVLNVAPQKWLDPNDSSTITLIYGPEMAGSGDSANYLSCASHADFNTSGGSYSVEFWVNPSFLPTGVTGCNRTFCSRGRLHAASSGSWAIVAGGSSGEANDVFLWETTDNAGTPGLAYVRSNNTAPWSHCVVTKNGTAVKIYLDGVEVTYGTPSGTMPATPQDFGALTIGREGHTSWIDANDVITRFKFWKGVVLSSGNVTTLYNSGTPLLYSELSSALRTGITAAYDFNSASLVLTDSSGNGHTLTATGTVTATNCIVGMTDKSINGFSFMAHRVGTGSTLVPHFCGAPRLLSNIQPSGNSMRSFASQTLYCAVTQPFAALSTDILENVTWTVPPSTSSEAFTICSADEGGTAEYSMTGITGSGGFLLPTARLKGTGAPDASGHGTKDTHIYGVTHVSASGNCQNWQLYGTGDGSSARCRYGAVAESPLDYDSGNSNAARNRTWADSVGRDNITLFGYRRSDGMSTGAFTCDLGECLVYSPGLSAADNVLVETWLRARSGL